MKCTCGSTSTRSAIGTASGRRCIGTSSSSSTWISSDSSRTGAVLEDAGVDQQLEVVAAGPLDEVHVGLGDRVLDRRRRVDLRADDDVELGGQLQRPLDGLLPDRVRVQVPGGDPELRPHRGEAQPGGQPQVLLDLRRALLGGEAAVAPHLGVDPGAVVGGGQGVAVQQGVPVVDPGRRPGSGSRGCCPRRGSPRRWHPGRRCRRARPPASSACRCRRCSCRSRRRTAARPRAPAGPAPGWPRR